MLTNEHLDLAKKVKNFGCSSNDRRAIASFLARQFQDEDEEFDRINWFLACGV